MAKLPAKKTCQDCGIEIRFAILAPTPAGQDPKWAAFEAQDRAPFSDAAVGCRVLVADKQAWRPQDLVEDYRMRLEITEDSAREIVGGFPFHRVHAHDRQETP